MGCVVLHEGVVHKSLTKDTPKKRDGLQFWSGLLGIDSCPNGGFHFMGSVLHKGIPRNEGCSW
eukprot:1938427-Amphidinium_carterae.1